MTYVQSAVLGIVQGLTEFLPVSSSGHLILVPRLLGWQDEGLAFDAAIHLGTLAALLVYFRRDLVEMVLGTDRRLAVLLAAAGFFIYGPQALIGITAANLATKRAAATAASSAAKR